MGLWTHGRTPADGSAQGGEDDRYYQRCDCEPVRGESVEGLADLFTYSVEVWALDGRPYDLATSTPVG